MNIVDTLVVTLGLDTTGLKQGAKDATATTTKLTTDLVSQADRGEKAQTGALANVAKAWNALMGTQRKAADAAIVTGKTMVGATERVADSGEKAIRTFGALFLLLAGGSSLKSFIASMVSLDATVGRIAHNTGSTTEVISGLGRAAERVGGTFNGAVGGVRGFVDAFQQLRTTGQSGIMEPLARLQGLGGKPIELGKDWHKSLMQIADDLHALDKRDPALADYLGRQILGDEGLVNLAKQGSAAMREAERSAPKITQAQAEAAQKLQAELAGVHQGFQDIGNSILLDFGPAMISGLKWVKGLVDANRGLIETKVSAWVKDVGQWFEAHKGDVEAFGTAIGQLATAAGALATAFASQSPMMIAMEAFAVFMGGRVLNAVGLVRGALAGLAALPAPAWLAAATGLSAVGTWQSSERTAQDFSDPKSAEDPRIGVNPETGLTYHVDKPAEDAPKIDTGNGVVAWIKSLYGFGPRGTQAATAPDTLAPSPVQGEDGNVLRRGEDASTHQGGLWASLKRLVGLGDDPAVREDIRDTQKNTRELRDLVKNGASLMGTVGTVTGAGDGGGTPNLRYGRGPGGSRAGNAGGYRGTPGTGQSYDTGPHVTLGKMGTKFVEKAPVIMDGLMKKYDLTREQAAGVLGNLGHESAGFTAYHEGGKAPGAGGVGWAQWTGSRRRAFETWTQAHGLNPTSDEASWRYLTEGDPETVKSIAAVKRTNNRYDAVRAFHDAFERSADISHGQIVKPNSWQSRLNYADKAFAAQPGGATAYVATAQAPVPAGTSAKAISDAEVFAARQRLTNGGRDPADRALVDRYLKEQNTPRAAPSHPDDDRTTRSRASDAPARLDPARQKLADAMNAPPSLTVSHAVQHVLRALSRARKLTQHDGHPVPVEMTDRSAMKLGEKTFGKYINWGRHHPDVLDRATKTLHTHAAAYGRMMHLAALGNVAHHATTHNVDRSVTSDTTVNGGIHVHTAATDARGIASDIEPHLRRGQAAARADYGLA